MNKEELVKKWVATLKQIATETGTVFKATGSRVFECEKEDSDYDFIMDLETIPRVLKVALESKATLYGCNGDLMHEFNNKTINKPKRNSRFDYMDEDDYFQGNPYQPFAYLNFHPEIKFNLLFMDKETQKQWVFATDMITEMLDHPAGFGVLERKIKGKDSRVKLFEALKEAVKP